MLFLRLGHSVVVVVVWCAVMVDQQGEQESYKIILAGFGYTGKTSLVRKYTDGTVRQIDKFHAIYLHCKISFFKFAS